MGNKIEKIFKSKISSLRHSKFLIALSGGVDSMVLANLFLNNNLNFSVTLVECSITVGVVFFFLRQMALVIKQELVILKKKVILGGSINFLGW